MPTRLNVEDSMYNDQSVKNSAGRTHWKRRIGGLALAAGLALIVVSCQSADTTAPAAEAPATTVAAETSAQTDAGAATTETTTDTAGSAGIAVAAKLNLNEATPDQFLTAIPDLGNRMVREFEEY